MYTLKATASFDSAHFLSGYKGKCANIHGHRWTITAEIYSDNLESEGQCRGMVVDFGQIKGDLKQIADSYDHALIFEMGTLKYNTVEALSDEGFKLIPVKFRPTAENFAKSFYDSLRMSGYNVKSVAVYETPDNCAVYSE